MFAAELAVHLNKDKVIATNGNYLPVIPRFLEPAVKPTDAEVIALKSVQGKGVKVIEETKLAYFNRSL